MAVQQKTNVVQLASAQTNAKFQKPDMSGADLPAPQAPADYYARIERYAEKIRKTKDVRDIISMLEEALVETRALHTVNEVAVARQQVALAELRIERLKTELELVSKLVREDQLTGALNRRGLDDALEREVARSERLKTPLCVALLDLDNFKNVNDALGHHVGDQVLSHLVNMVMQTIRTNDMIGRYGGDEFLVLMPGSQIEDAYEVISRLKRRLALTPLRCETQELLVTFSAGVAMRHQGEDTQTMIQRADHAMYEAKTAGRDRISAAPEK
jgi:diguanylate cyclase